MSQSILPIILLLTILIGYLFATKKENLIPPWELENCRASCYAQGQEIPWFGGDNGSWRDPANFESSTFDVGGCMAKCDLATWYGDQY